MFLRISTKEAALALLFAAAAVAQIPPPARNSTKVTQYLIVSGRSMSGSWDSRDEGRIAEWRARYSSEFVWFRQNGRDYLVSDSRMLSAFQNAMAPQREVNEHQEEVNGRQEEVNRLQERVNSRQEDVNRAQQEVNRQQNLVTGGSGEQSRVNRLQAEVNHRQQTVNAEQEKVNAQQAIVNHAQEGVNGMQARASAEIDRALQTLFESALQSGAAHEPR